MRKTKIAIGLISAIACSSFIGIVAIFLNTNTFQPQYYPSLKWVDPKDGDIIIFGTENSQFKFDYNYNPLFIDQVKLFMNDIFIDDVTHNTSIELDYQESIDGQCEAILLGYKNGVMIENDTIHLIFGKIITDETLLLDEGEKNLGMKPFLILHDPNGDQSYSTIMSNMNGAPKLAMGVNGTVTTHNGIVIDSSFDFERFNDTNSYPYPETVIENGSQWGFDFRYVTASFTGFTYHSSIYNNNPDYIGPGIGDRYYGENWTLCWFFNCKYLAYFNGTEIYSNPLFNYGIKYCGALNGININDAEFPEEWKKFNPALNNFNDDMVEWNDVSNQLPVINSTNLLSDIVNISVSEAASSHFGGIGTNFSFEIATKMFDVYNTYYIGDDEVSDYINNRVGIDKNFGTLIFQNLNSSTTNPHEYNT